MATTTVTQTQALALATASQARAKSAAARDALASTIDQKKQDLANALTFHTAALAAAQAQAAADDATWATLVQAAIADPLSTIVTVDPTTNSITTDLKTNVVAATIPTDLPLAKQNMRDAIDARSEELIAKGFIFGGKRYSLSTNAQLKWLGIMIGAGSMSYPYNVPTLDGADSFAIPDAATVAQMYGAAMTTVATILAQGVVLKGQVNAAVDASGVAAVVDTRV